MVRYQTKRLSVFPWEGKRRGFTLIELLVVIAIISLIISILLPSLQHAKELARETVCVSNTRNIGMIMQYYAEDNANSLPIPEDRTGTKSRYRFWSVALAEYITEDESVLDPDGYMISPIQPELVVKHFQCPTLQGVHPTQRGTYVMNNYSIINDPNCFSQGLNLEAVYDPYCRVAVGEGAFSYGAEGAKFEDTFFRINNLGFYHNQGDITGMWSWFGTQYEQTDGRGTLLMVDGHAVSADLDDVAAIPDDDSSAIYFTKPY